MRDAAGVIYRWLAALFLLGVVVQFFLAGLGVFRSEPNAGGGATATKAAFDHSFGPHIVLGDILVMISVALVVLVVVSGMGRKVLLATLAVLLLVIVQAVLASAGPPAVRALHPVGVLAGAGYALCVAGLPWLRDGCRGRS